MLGGCLLLGLVFGGWLLGMEIKETRLADRYVTVKGLVERTVKSDSAVWPVTYKETGNDLQQVYAKSEDEPGGDPEVFCGAGNYAAGDICGTDPGDRQAGE